jgi:hypothetical protein
MRRITRHTYALRVSLLTSVALALAAALPVVALAGSGDPLGFG